jgi:hypothetical protein
LTPNRPVSLVTRKAKVLRGTRARAYTFFEVGTNDVVYMYYSIICINYYVVDWFVLCRCLQVSYWCGNMPSQL